MSRAANQGYPSIARGLDHVEFAIVDERPPSGGNRPFRASGLEEAPQDAAVADKDAKTSIKARPPVCGL